MARHPLPVLLLTVVGSLIKASPCAGQQPRASLPATTEGDYVAKNFQFRSGESLPELRLHYTTLGQPVRDGGVDGQLGQIPRRRPGQMEDLRVRDAQGRVSNAVLILHGTGGTGHQFLNPVFAGELFQPGQLLDAARYYLILPDGIGHGKSLKPSDGLHARFPPYDYDDMVLGHYRLLTEGLEGALARDSSQRRMLASAAFASPGGGPDFKKRR